jgi:hypothetical protein
MSHPNKIGNRGGAAFTCEQDVAEAEGLPTVLRRKAQGRSTHNEVEQQVPHFGMADSHTKRSTVRVGSFRDDSARSPMKQEACEPGFLENLRSEVQSDSFPDASQIELNTRIMKLDAVFVPIKLHGFPTRG